MHTDDDSQLTLSKWPFYLGDGLLVGIALAIAILGDWNLDSWQVLSCVLGVAMGAALLCLPFLYEHWLRMREQVDDRSAQLRVLERRIEELMETVLIVQDELEQRQLQIHRIEQASAGVVDAVNRKVEQLKIPAVAEPDPRVAELVTEVEALTEARQRLEAKLTTLEEKNAALAGDLEALGQERESTSPAPVKARARRQPRRPEARLLHRAIKDRAADQKSGAVSRIIESRGKGKPEESEGPEVVEDEAQPDFSAVEATVVPVSEIDNPHIEMDSTTEGPEEEFEAGSLDEVRVSSKAEETLSSGRGAEPMVEWETHGLSGSDEELKEDEGKDLKAEVPGVEKAAKLEVEENASDVFSDDIDLTAEVPAMEASDLLFESISEPKLRKQRVKKNDTILTVSVLIGIGNKPFIRGSGAGLNWERGVPLEFESIGSWRWLAPAELDEAVEFQVFRNDEDPDANGRFRLEPGEKLEIEPRF